MVPKRFEAKWRGSCDECEGRFDAGAMVGYQPGATKVSCSDCLDGKPEQPVDNAPLCPECFTYHKGECW